MPGRKSQIWTIPNVLTIFRFLLIPTFAVLMLKYRMDTEALFVFIVASATDVLDGYIARKTHAITDFGKLADPIADKLMVLTVVTALMIRSIIPWYALAMLALKELIMLWGGAYMFKKKIVVHSLFAGKLAQFLLSAALILSFFHQYFEGMTLQPHLVLLWLGIATAYVALYVYVSTSVRQVHGEEQIYDARTVKEKKK